MNQTSTGAAEKPKRGPGRPRIPLTRVIEAALAIVEERGSSALSMRVLAARLDTGTAVLYRAVSGRSELIELMVDAVIGERLLASTHNDPGGWKMACRQSAIALFEALALHPGLAALVIEKVPVGPNALIVRERMLARLLDDGFSPARAARVYATVARLAVGFAAQLPRKGVEESDSASVREQFLALPPDRFPAIRVVAESLPAQRVADEFRYGLDMLLAGIASGLEGAPDPRL